MPEDVALVECVAERPGELEVKDLAVALFVVWRESEGESEREREREREKGREIQRERMRRDQHNLIVSEGLSPRSFPNVSLTSWCSMSAMSM